MPQTDAQNKSQSASGEKNLPHRWWWITSLIYLATEMHAKVWIICLSLPTAPYHISAPISNWKWYPYMLDRNQFITKIQTVGTTCQQPHKSQILCIFMKAGKDMCLRARHIQWYPHLLMCYVYKEYKLFSTKTPDLWSLTQLACRDKAERQE